MNEEATLVKWLLSYLLSSLFWLWILAFGGARWVEGWKSFLLIDWFAHRWDEEGIRLFALLFWVATTVWFVLGVFVPELRILYNL